MGRKRKKRDKKPLLPPEVKQGIWAVFLVLIAVLVGLSFLGKAGVAGDVFIKNMRFLIGEASLVVPLILVLAGLVIFKAIKDTHGKKEVFDPTILAVIIMIFGSSAFLGIFEPETKLGGLIGYLLSWPGLKYFGFWASFFIYLAPIAIGLFIFWHFLRSYGEEEKEIEKKEDLPEKKKEEKTSIMRKIFAPKFKTEDLFPPAPAEDKGPEKEAIGQKAEARISSGSKFAYIPPPIDLLEKDHGSPTSGDTRVNASIIKKTLQNFGIDVAMSEINIGPTVTQYTFKPAEGIKLSKITGLSNDLSLALASHPIRIEAPVPGRSLVGVEIPNKVRAQVRLRKLIESPEFQKVGTGLILPLGKDVSGNPFYTDITRMPHMLVAGSTGTGKTIFLNSLIMSLLYQPSTAIKSAGPDNLRLILVDPKRVEFPVFASLPHLLCPVIYNASQTVNALRWLTQEMERRFDVLSEMKSRDIGGYNENALKNKQEPLPYIVLIIDELADLMMAKGREIEAGIVRLAQMARAVGIHLVVATQRPSVEVITGLIKANITTRVTFQVASQVDSRTVLDSSGAEKLLGAGDMLFISAQVPKPKRIQSPYISEKEVRRVISHIKSKQDEIAAEMDSGLVDELERSSEDQDSRTGNGGSSSYSSGADDPMFEEAKKVVIESKRASASLLQRRLRLGYARAARLIDMLEDKGIVGPAEGSKPREVYGEARDEQVQGGEEVQKEGEEWEKI